MVKHVTDSAGTPRTIRSGPGIRFVRANQIYAVHERFGFRRARAQGQSDRSLRLPKATVKTRRADGAAIAAWLPLWMPFGPALSGGSRSLSPPQEPKAIVLAMCFDRSMPNDCRRMDEALIVVASRL